MSFSVDNGKVVRQSSVGILPPYAPLYRFGDIRGFCEGDVHELRDLVYLMMCSVARGDRPPFLINLQMVCPGSEKVFQLGKIEVPRYYAKGGTWM